jgi:hypothetical protein
MPSPPFPFIEGRGPFLDSLLIEYAAIELASEGRRMRPGPLTGVPFPFLLGGPRVDTGLLTRLISPAAKRGNLRSSS